MSLLLDHHTHSNASFDAADTVDALASHALKNGLSTLAITDHCDLGLQTQPDWRARLDHSVSETLRVRAQTPNKLTLLVGIELGQPQHDPALAQQILAAHPYDLVLGSLHNVKGCEDFYFFQEKPTPAEMLHRYFEELIDMARHGGFDILSHLTYPYRYLRPSPQLPPITAFEEQLRCLFGVLVERGISLEVNTSGIYRAQHTPPMPDLWELTLYRACGGTLVTLGSDSHHAPQVGGGLREGLALLSAAGFAYQTTFLQRKAIPSPI